VKIKFYLREMVFRIHLFLDTFRRSLIFIIRKKNTLLILRKEFRRLFNIYYSFFKLRKIQNYNSLKNLIDFTFSFNKGYIKPLQDKSEILGLLIRCEKIHPQYILEIGTARGGTLFFFSRIADKNAGIISIDLPGGSSGGGYSKLKIPLYKSFARKNQEIHLFRANSHDINTLKKVRKILKRNHLDILFIDGDHSYEGVKKDFEMYSPLVKNEGFIIFHDINCVTMGVYKFWKEIKKKYLHEEIIQDWNFKELGIGVLTNMTKG